ncbi:MAG: hypothetical protein F6J90_39405 [Moorea sp. SIOASIH]|uniref:hypothetical protein n=1 Tax=Moorena sp. SIOASIH TaxID=2607817 RepID=UPI0013BD94B4|nr:hypothetical protein [Moorena sp. SIOASIH]NEO42066.1 hypothetical protein [Moorena sp. SIOASIH]
MENKNPPDQLQSYSEKRMKIMKRQIKVFTALLLAVVLAFGSQVASAFALTNNKFELSKQGDTHRVQLDPFKTEIKSYFVNNSSELAEINISIQNSDTEKFIINQNALFQEKIDEIDGANAVEYTNLSHQTIQVMVLDEF